MITQQDAVAVGKQIVLAMQRSEQEAGTNETQRLSARGTAIYALDNLWYEVFPESVKKQFLYNNRHFYSACNFA